MAQLIASCEPDYPPLLAALDAPPPFLAARGDVRLLHRPCVAIVGACKGLAAAIVVAERLAAALGEAGFTLVSGRGRGVDGAAHPRSLQTGRAAVLAGGVDQPYPPQHRKLYDAICEQGVVVSEARFGAVARARDFPRRNTIIAGLARGVVAVEAALRSGSLITARGGRTWLRGDSRAGLAHGCARVPAWRLCRPRARSIRLI